MSVFNRGTNIIIQADPGVYIREGIAAAAAAAASADAAANSAESAATNNFRTFDNVTALLANSSIVYGTGAAQVAAGDIMQTRAEGFAYEVAAEAATDQHVTTAGGVKLYVLPGGDGRRSVNALGAANDGTTDDAAIFASAMSIGGEWDATGSYLVGSLQTGTVSFSLYGDVLIRHGKNHGALRFLPPLGAAVSVTSIGANANYPALSTNLSTPLTVDSTAGLERGQVCMLRSSDAYAYGNGVPKAEIIRILEISGSTVYTHGVIEDTYATSITLTPLGDAEFVVDGPTFEVNEDVYSATTPYGYRGSLEFAGCVRPRANVSARNGLGAGVACYSCWAPDITVHASDLRDRSADNALGYGAVAGAATKYGTFHIIAERVRHAFTDGDYGGLTIQYDGVPRRNTVRGMAVACTAAAWDTHEESHDALFDGCEAYFGNGDADSTGILKYGFQVRGRNVSLVNPRVRGMPGAYIIQDYAWGQASAIEIVEPDWEIGDAASEVPFALLAHAQPEARKVVFRGGSFEGSPTISNNAPEIEIYGTTQRGATTFRLGQNNRLTALGFSRISDGNITEAIVVDAGSTLWIDNHFIKTGPTGFIGGGRVVQTGTTAGTATVFLGKITEAAVAGGALTPVAQITTTLSLQPLPSAMASLGVGNVPMPNVAGVVNAAARYEVNGVRVVTSQQTAVANVTGGATVDAEARTAINALLARLRAHGLIAT